ncbi:MAG: hypothetical protein LBU58_10220, partial [Clostridiales bacterium]|nr:hypothetical protein [Clostridiales bacterium]
MLYPKNGGPLDAALFKNPGREYRGAPFWAWNSKLDEGELLRQIEVLKKMGFGGFHMHVRTGMDTVYLSDEHMRLVSACIEKARGEDMLAWLYDEDRWPSGAAGGYVTKDPAYRLRHLLLTRNPRPAVGEVGGEAGTEGAGDGAPVACYEVSLDGGGNLARYRRVGEDDKAAEGGFKLYAYLRTAEPSPWYNNQTYADTLNPAAIAEFIRVTYERYGQFFAKDLGGVAPAIFTDEPQFSIKGTLDFAHAPKDVTLPWTDDLPETFSAAYPGIDLLASIPELLWEPAGGGVSRLRYLYHDHIAERFAQAFADQCGGWCEKHGLMLTGHMLHEESLESQTMALGDAMRSYRSFQLPGIDMLCDRYEYTTAKQAQSASRQFGAPGVLSELYGVTNWDFDFRGHKTQGDWQAALGVTVRVPHLSWVSMNGEAKRDYPGSFNYQAPWYEKYALVEDHFARVNTAMTRGRPVARIGVIHPVESYWLHWGAKENTRAAREQLDEQFANVTEWLLLGTLDFDFIAESLLEGQCALADIPAAAAETAGSAGTAVGAPAVGAPAVGGVGLPVGKMRYETIVVPGCETLRKSTLDRLERFRDAGGEILFIGGPPKYADAVPDGRGERLYARCAHVGFERVALLDALARLREVDIRDSSGARAKGLVYQLREEGAAQDAQGTQAAQDAQAAQGQETRGARWLFVAHAKAPANKDILQEADVYQFRVRGVWSCELYDTQCGDIFPIEAAVDATDAADSAESADASNFWTTVTRPLYEHDSLLLKLTPKAADVSVPAVSAAVGATDGLLVTARPGWPTPADARSGPAAGAAPRQHFYNA